MATKKTSKIKKLSISILVDLDKPEDRAFYNAYLLLNSAKVAETCKGAIMRGTKKLLGDANNAFSGASVEEPQDTTVA